MAVDDSFLVQFIQNSLSPNYEPFQINYNTIKDKWHVNELASKLVQEEARLKNQENHSISLMGQGASKALEAKLTSSRRRILRIHIPILLMLRKKNIWQISVTSVRKFGIIRKIA